jgi:hypothetical protein
MWKNPLAAALIIVALGIPASAGPSMSISDLQKAYDRAYPNQKIFDDNNLLIPRPRNTAESSVLAPDSHAGKNIDKLRPPVELKAPTQQAQEAQTGTMAGNPPTATLLGLTELKYPYEKASHYGPPTYYDYYLLFRYQQPPTVTNLDVGTCFGSQAAAQAAFQKMPLTFGIPITDSADYINKMTLNAKLVDELTSPGRWMKISEAWQQAQQQDMANSTGQAAEVAFAGDLADIQGDLYNIANERGARPAQPRSKTRTVEEVTWMVQEAFKKIYMPIALLLLLPGAILTQMRGMVSYGFRINSEVTSPFDGILKAVIAIFLIPSTQLIISYSIDVGNSMTHVVSSYGIDPKTLMLYANAELYDVPFSNTANQLAPQWENVLTRDSKLEDVVIFDFSALWSGIISGISNLVGSIGSFFGFGGGGGGGGTDVAGGLGGSLPGMGGSSGGSAAAGPSPFARGKATAAPEEESQLETQSRMTTQMQYGFNAMNMLDCSIISILLEFQTIMMCYLLLLGPIAAAFYAWPSQGPFKGCFVSWVNGVVTLSLWRFWWCLILLCMNVRILWLQDMHEYHINSEWEMLVFSAFSVLMTAVPFQPFDFKVGELVEKVLSQAEKTSKEKAESKVKSGDVGQPQGDTHTKAGATGSRNDGSDGEHSRSSSPTAAPSGKDESDAKTPPAGPPPASSHEPSNETATVSAAPTQSFSPVSSDVTPPPLSREGAEA